MAAPPMLQHQAGPMPPRRFAGQRPNPAALPLDKTMTIGGVTYEKRGGRWVNLEACNHCDQFVSIFLISLYVFFLLLSKFGFSIVRYLVKNFFPLYVFVFFYLTN